MNWRRRCHGKSLQLLICNNDIVSGQPNMRISLNALSTEENKTHFSTSLLSTLFKSFYVLFSFVSNLSSGLDLNKRFLDSSLLRRNHQLLLQ